MYDHLFFDADGTLFDFEAAEKWALTRVFTELGFPSDEELIRSYSSINNGVWLEFEQGNITMNELKVERFRRFFALHQVEGNPAQTAERYMEMLSQSYHLYPDALSVLDILQEQHIPMSLITNGISHVQRGRIAATRTGHYFNAIVISEEIGVQKPHPDYFTRTLELARQSGNPTKRPLIIGDSPSSDIRGGLNSGIDTCWINRFGMNPDPTTPATYEITNLHGLVKLLQNLN